MSLFRCAHALDTAKSLCFVEPKNYFIGCEAIFLSPRGICVPCFTLILSRCIWLPQCAPRPQHLELSGPTYSATLLNILCVLSSFRQVAQFCLERAQILFKRVSSTARTDISTLLMWFNNCVVSMLTTITDSIDINLLLKINRSDKLFSK